ncbi:MAG: hypothetical protein ABL921_11135 [Pirellula sp.]
MKRNSITLLLTATLVFACGCEPGEITIRKKESHADLVVIYNAEVQALDALEKKRKEMVAEFSKKAQEDAIKAMAGSLGSLGSSAPSNPNNALDQAVAAAEAQAKLLKQVTQSSSETSEFPEELKRQLAEIDAEIAKQKERVQRAKDKRDASETDK